MTKPPSQWRGGAGGAPILSHPIGDYRRYPVGGWLKPSWSDVLVVPVLLVVVPITLVMWAMGRLR